MTKPNILLIMLDAVRADNLSVYGYEREITPNLEKIREEFQIYQNPISASHWSLPSAASLFTGTYPSTHGLIHDDTVLDSRFTTLAQFLKTQGYATIGICPNPYISHETGLDRGFDVFPGRGVDPLKNVMARFREGKEKIEDRNEKPKVSALAQQKSTLEKILMTDHIRRLEWFIRGKMDKYAASTNARFIREIKKSDINQPFFAYLHYDEAHTPYIIPNNYRTKFQVNKKVKPWKVNQDWVKYYIEKPDISDEEFQALKDVYDGGILYLDKIIYNLYCHIILLLHFL